MSSRFNSGKIRDCLIAANGVMRYLFISDWENSRFSSSGQPGLTGKSDHSMRENTQINQVTWELMSQTGDAFFCLLVEHLATVLGLRVAFIVESLDTKGEWLKPLVCWGVQGFRENKPYLSKGTPCERLAHGAAGIYPHGLADHFPEDGWLHKSGMQSYVAIPLLNDHAHVLGHIGVLDDRVMDETDEVINLLETFAPRVKSEIIKKQRDELLQTTSRKLQESEEQFSSLLDNTICGLLFINPETYQFIECNRSICEMLGYSREELQQRSITDIYQERDHTRVRSELETLPHHERSQLLDVRVKRKDGSLFDANILHFWMNFHGSKCLAGAYIDVTGNKKIEQALRLEKEKLTNYLENAAVMTLVLDEHGTVLLVNRMGCDVLGKPVEDIIGRNWFENFLPERIRDEVRQVYDKLLAGDIEPVEAYENLVINAKGEERLISWRNSVLKNRQGKIVATLPSGTDITDERNAELELESARRRLQFVVKNAPAIIFACEAREPYSISYLTDNAVEQLGYKLVKLQGRSGFWSEITHPDDLSDVIDTISRFFQEGHIQTEMRIRLSDGSYRWYQNNMKLIRDIDGQPLEIFGYLMDIHQAKEADLALQEREARLAYAQKLARIGSWERDLIENTERWSDEIYRIFGYAPQAITPSELKMLHCIHPDDRDKFKSTMARSIASRENFDIEFRVCRNNNEVRHVRSLNEVVRDHNGEAVSLLGTLQDVTRRREAEAQLRRSHEELRWLADHLQSARESERIAIAREIHDEMAQSLTAQKIDLVRLKSKLPVEDAYLTGLSEDMLQSVNQTINSVQRILTELRPALLDDLGLLAAIEWQMEQFGKRTEMICHLQLPDKEPELTQKERTALFRIMQEALSNVLRHSNATEMWLELTVDNSWLLMSIIDNGIGVSELDATGSKSFGLMGMRERAHIFGGTVTIKAKEGKGTTVSTKFPLNHLIK